MTPEQDNLLTFMLNEALGKIGEPDRNTALKAAEFGGNAGTPTGTLYLIVAVVISQYSALLVDTYGKDTATDYLLDKLVGLTDTGRTS